MPASRGAGIALAGFAALLLVAASDDLRGEIGVAASRRHLAGASGGCGAIAHGDLEGEPRERVADALCLARAATPLPPGARRDALLHSAAKGLRGAIEARPLWPEALTVSAYIDSLAGGEAPAAEARQALALSYIGAPYLPDAADWRIDFGLSQWAGLTEATRNAVVAEAMWRMAIDQSRGPALFAQFRASPAYIPFILRWNALSIEWERRTQGLPPG